MAQGSAPVETPPAQPEPTRSLIVVTGMLLACFVPYYIATIDWSWPIPRDGTTLVVGRDFLNFWMYGRAAAEADPVRYYDLATYWSATEAITGASYPHQQWSYPPTLMLIAAPFGQLAYLPALLLWTVLGMTVFFAAIRMWTRDARLIFPLLFAPAAVFGIMSGQLFYVVSAAILAVLRWRESRPILAGIILGMLTLKPQLGIFFPVMLLATRNWRAILAAAVTALITAGLSAAIWGTEIWTAYLNIGFPNQSQLLTDPEKPIGPFMPTLFMNARLAGASLTSAMALQVVAAAFAAAGIAWVFWKRPAATDLRANGFFLAAAVFGTPYTLSYDTLSLSVMAALILAGGGQGRLLPLMIYLLPLFQFTGLPGPAILPILFAGQMLLELARDTSAGRKDGAIKEWSRASG